MLLLIAARMSDDVKTCQLQYQNKVGSNLPESKEFCLDSPSKIIIVSK